MTGNEAINGFVLAGGKSRRMGQDKALLELGGRQLVLRAAEALRPFVSQVSLLAPLERYPNLGLPVIADDWPDQGPLAALCTALRASPTEWNIFLPCDLPRVGHLFVELLIQKARASHADAVVPRTREGWQPLSAAYRSRCGAAFEEFFHAGDRSVIRALDGIRVEELSEQDMAAAGLGGNELANVNTPADWARISALWEGGQ